MFLGVAKLILAHMRFRHTFLVVFSIGCAYALKNQYRDGHYLGIMHVCRHLQPVYISEWGGGHYLDSVSVGAGNFLQATCTSITKIRACETTCTCI